MSHFISLRLPIALLPVLLAILAPKLLPSQSGRDIRVMKTLPPAGGRAAVVVGDSAELRLNRSAIDFAGVEFGSVREDSVAVMNVGSAPLAIGTIGIGGDDASAFSLGESVAGTTLPASRFVWQSVSFHPLDTGCFEAWLVVTSSAGVDSIPLRGCGSYSTARIGRDTLDFGLVRVDSCKLLLDSIPNPVGEAIRLFGAIVSGGAFESAMAPLSVPTVVPPGGYIGPIAIRFCPDGRGAFGGEANLVTDRGLVAVELLGRGAAPAIEVEPDSLDFGRVSPGEYRDLPLIVRNIGELPLRVVRSGSPGPFSLLPGEPSDVTIAAGGTRSLSFRFLPPAAGSYSAIDTLHTNASDGELLLTLRGRGAMGYSLHLDTVSGAVGDTLALHLLIDPPRDSSAPVPSWTVRLRVDPHALRILGPSASSPSISLNRIGDDGVTLAGRLPIPPDGLLASIDILGLSTALPVNPVAIVDASFDSLEIEATGDGSVLLSGCIIGNAVPLARRSAILGLRWDVSGMLTVRYRLPGSAVGTVRVVDMLARELLRATVPGPGDQERELALPLAGAPGGIYFVELLVADDMSVMPVMRGR